MSLINTTIKPFKATAYHNGKFVPVSDADLKGKWSVVFFYPADFTFVCPTELGDLADHYDTFKKLGLDRHAFHAQGLARRVRYHQENPVPHDRRSHRRDHAQFRSDD